MRKKCFLFTFVSRYFFSDFWLEFSTLGLPNRCVRMEGTSTAKIDFSWKSFSKNFGTEFKCFLDALGAVFLTFQASKTNLKTKRFFMKSRISSLGSGEGDLGVLGLLQT